jgi:hypothetical protein
MHFQEAADAFALVFRDVQHAIAGFQVAGVHANERQLADKRISHDLESQPGERFIVRRFANDDLLRMFRINAFGWWDVQGRRQIVHDCVEQRLHAFVLERSSAEHRE